MGTLDFSNIEAPQALSADWVLKRVPDSSIFYQYFGDFVPYKKSYNSVFRKDRTASTGFYFGEAGKLKYKDMGTGESWDCFSFVAQLYNISYFEAVKKVACEFGLITCEDAPLEKIAIAKSFSFDKKRKEDTILQIVPDVWTKRHGIYWKKFGITKKELEANHVFPIDQLFINKNFISNKEDNMRFALLLPTPSEVYMKIYTPYADKWKWITNCPLHIPFGMDNLTYDSDTVIITKSVKEMMIWKKFFPSVIATQNESPSALNSGMVKHLTEKFENRIIAWDADETGVENCTKFNKLGFGYFNTPKNLLKRGIKDVGEFVEEFGLKTFEDYLKYKKLL